MRIGIGQTNRKASAKWFQLRYVRHIFHYRTPPHEICVGLFIADIRVLGNTLLKLPTNSYTDQSLRRRTFLFGYLFIDIFYGCRDVNGFYQRV